MADLSKLDAFKLADTEFLMVFLCDERGRLLGESVTVSKGPLCMVAIEPADVLVPALRAGAQRILLVHFRPLGDVEPAEEHHLHNIRFFVEVVNSAKPLGIVVLDYKIIGDPFARCTPIFSYRERALGRQALSYHSNW